MQTGSRQLKGRYLDTGIGPQNLVQFWPRGVPKACPRCQSLLYMNIAKTGSVNAGKVFIACKNNRGPEGSHYYRWMEQLAGPHIWFRLRQGLKAVTAVPVPSAPPLPDS